LEKTVKVNGDPKDEQDSQSRGGNKELGEEF
jgi:hypothetical protein